MIEHVDSPGFSAILGQELPIRFLQTFLDQGKIPHAMLFTGLPGVGKRTTARAFAMALNCMDGTHAEQKPCGRCRSCKQILGGRHPDVLFIEPKGAFLRINQIRELLGVLAMKPYVAKNRVVVLVKAQAMNLEAGNALLKALEEPPADTILILTADQQADLLPTLVSRCRHIRFKPLCEAHLKALLASHRDLNGEQAATIARMSDGSFSKALELVDTGWQDKRNWLVQASGLGQPDQMKHRSVSLAFSFSRALAKDKESAPMLLDMLKTWVRDLWVIDFAPELVVNRDSLNNLAKARSKTSPTQLLGLWRSVEKAQKDVAANANLRLTLDTMMLDIIAGADNRA